MKSLYDFIVKPLNNRYDNEKKIGDKTLIEIAINYAKNSKKVNKKLNID